MTIDELKDEPQTDEIQQHKQERLHVQMLQNKSTTKFKKR